MEKHIINDKEHSNKLGIVLLIIVLVISILIVKNALTKNSKPEIETQGKIENTEAIKKDEIKSIKITAAGDCTIGWDHRYEYYSRYDKYLDDNDGDYGYYFAKVKDIFANDDLTIVNLEGCFTNSKNMQPADFHLSAPPEYKQVLPLGNVDVVSFANNHTDDYGEEGYQDTLDALESISMPYYSYDKYLIKEINGIKVGFFALCDIECENYQDIDNAIEYLKNKKCELIIASMHWGIERMYKQNEEQVEMGHYLIDNGVDLVLGSHPHVIQGIEKYNGKYIVYSLSNFTFGANQNPGDKDTLIFQQIFTIKNGKLELDDNINIIPASQSGVKDKNNYQPIALEGQEGESVLKKILKYSTGFEYDIKKLLQKGLTT